MTLIECVAAVALVLGSAAVLWAVKIFDGVGVERPRPVVAPPIRRDTSFRKAA